MLFALMLNSSPGCQHLPGGLLAFVSKFSVDFGQMMAAGVMALIPVCALFFVIQRYLVQGPTSRMSGRVTQYRARVWFTHRHCERSEATQARRELLTDPACHKQLS